MFRLFKEEGILDASIARAYYEARAKVFAARVDSLESKAENLVIPLPPPCIFGQSQELLESIERHDDLTIPFALGPPAQHILKRNRPPCLLESNAEILKGQSFILGQHAFRSKKFVFSLPPNMPVIRKLALQPVGCMIKYP
jgi:hypothetical protein